MSQEISLKKAERKVFRMAHNDGLWDVFIGSFFLQFAIAPLLSRSLGDFWSSFVFLPFWALLFIIILLVRKYVISPRIGTVKFGSFRKQKLMKFSLLMVAVNVVAFIAGLLFALNTDVTSPWIHIGILGFTILVISSFAAHFLNFIRLFVYGLLFLIALVVGEWSFASYHTAHHGFPITFGISAGIIIITGLYLFIRLLIENPIPMNESLSQEKRDE